MTIAYHYCDFMDTRSLSPASILLNLLSQLLPRNGDWIEDFPGLISRKERREPPPANLQDICELIQKVPKYHHQVAVAVDALDELENNGDREELLQLLRGLGLKGISVFLTSRREQDIMKVFHDVPSISLKDMREQVEVDMKAYIDEAFQKRPNLARLRLRDGLNTEISITLIKKADGM